MRSDAETVEEYVENLPQDRKKAINKLRDAVKMNLAEGFTEEMNYGMIGYVVPLSIYPEGYLGKKTQPLPFMNIASQKNYVAVYLMCLYADQQLMKWFKEKYEAAYSGKLDMGKSCLRFKHIEQISYELIGEVAGKMTVEQWIDQYESSRGA